MCTCSTIEWAPFVLYPLGPFPLTQIVALIWVAIRIATQISATIFIFMCGDRKVAIISAILIAIRAPLIVRLFENNRDYFQIISNYFLCEVCENGERKSYRFFISHHARRAGAPFSINNGGYYDINNEPLLGTHTLRMGMQ